MATATLAETREKARTGDGESDVPRLASDHAEQIGLLLNMVSLSRLGGIATAECDDVELRKRLFGHCAKRLAERDIYLYPVQVSDKDLNLVRFLRDLTDKSGFKDLELVGRYKNIVLFVYGFESYTEEQQETFLHFLNLFRDGTTIIRQPLVIWARGEFLARIAHEAPDFWSWKGMTFQFRSRDRERKDGEEHTGWLRYVHAVGEDPDFAAWRDLYVPMRASIVRPNGGARLECHDQPDGQRHKALIPSCRWVPGANGECGWVRAKTSSLFDVLVIRPGERTAILGEPGGGKTALLRYLTFRHARLAMRQLPENDRGALVPVFVQLNRLRGESSIEGLIFDALKEHELVELHDIGDLDRLLAPGARPEPGTAGAARLLLLFDGLNEVAASSRDLFQSFLGRLSSQHAVLVTCRIEDYTTIPGFETVLLEPLDKRDIERHAVRCLGDERGKQLAAEVKRDRQLLELARTPLALFMLAKVSDHGEQALPRNRGVLFQRFTESLLKRTETEWWKLFGRTKAKVNVEVSRAALSHLALLMQRERVTAISLERCYWGIKESAFETPISASTKDIFEGLLYSGLVRLSANRQNVEFMHQMVRDYYAAVQLRANNESVSDLLKGDCAHWMGTVLLLFGISDERARLYGEIVGDGQDYNRLWLAAHCLANVKTERGAWKRVEGVVGASRRERAVFALVRAMVHEADAELKEALHDLREATQIDDSYHFAYYDLGAVYRDLGDQESAIGAFRELLSRIPDFVDAYNHLGITYYEGGDPARALMAFAAAVELEPNNHHHYFNAGFVCKDLYRYAQAREAFRCALVLKPGYDEAKEQLALLEDTNGGGVLGLLDRVRLFRSLPLESRQDVARSLRPRSIRAGQDIVMQGQAEGELLIIESGLAEVLLPENGGKQVVLSRLGPGDAFGEGMLPKGVGQQHATLRAITPLRVQALGRDNLAEIQSRHPEIAEKLVQTGYERLAQAGGRPAGSGGKRASRATTRGQGAAGGYQSLDGKSTTVLVADLLALSAWSEAIGPSAVIEFFGQFYLEIMHAFGDQAILWQDAGNELLALFDDPVNAVLNAISLQAAYATLVAGWSARSRRGRGAGLGIGICTGPILGEERGRTGGAGGTPIVLAERLSERARKSGEILIDEATFGAIGRVISALPLSRGSLLQGFEHPVKVYRVAQPEVRAAKR